MINHVGMICSVLFVGAPGLLQMTSRNIHIWEQQTSAAFAEQCGSLADAAGDLWPYRGLNDVLEPMAMGQENSSRHHNTSSVGSASFEIGPAAVGAGFAFR